MSNTEKLESLSPKCQEKVKRFLVLAKQRGYGRLYITEGLRSLDRQFEYYGRGRTALQCRLAGVPTKYANPKAVQVTWINPRKGKHVTGDAVDISITNYPKSHWEIIGQIGELAGMTWGGRWKCRDYMHFEI